MNANKTLVLNLDFSPISVCSVQRAFLLLFLDKADMVCENSRDHFHTIDRTFPMPSVIKLKRYISVPYKGVVLSRDNVFRRDGYQCQYCGTNRDLTLDHVIPKAKGGKTHWTNLVTACKQCNSRKGDFLPDEAGMPLSMPPFKPSYIMFLRDFSGVDHREWEPYLITKKYRVA
jgi:5-methylcytosine-specific restriction endonuclease McrA